jgi:hypothetical protein
LPASPLTSQNNPILTLRKTASLALRAAPFAPGHPNDRGTKGTQNMICNNRITLIVFSARTPRPDPHQMAPLMLASRLPLM